MIKVVQGDRQTCQSFVEDLKSRVGQTSPEIEQSVREIIEAVRTGGDRAVKEFSKKFDGWTPRAWSSPAGNWRRLWRSATLSSSPP